MVRDMWGRLQAGPMALRAGGARWDAASAALMVLAAIVILCTFADYGITWDEVVQDNYGAAILRYYASWFRDRAAAEYLDLYNYGGLFDVLAVGFAGLSPLDHFESRHLLNAAFGFFGIAGCWRLARVIGGPRTAFFAVALLASTPSWFGHMFNNPKDIPFAALFVWALAALALLLRNLPAVDRRRAIEFGVWTGLACAVRIGAAVIFFYALAIGAAILIARWHHLSRGSVVRTAVELILLPGAIAYLVMLPFWPYAQLSPILNPLRALAFFAAVPESIPVEFEGRLLSSLAVPPDYLAVMFALKLPELTVAVLPLGLWVALRPAKAGALRLWPGHTGLIFLAVAFPLVFIALARSDMFDGIRHVLFVLPPLVCFAALGLDALLTALSRARPWMQWSGGGGLAAYGIIQAALLVTLHPYETVYYNAFAGGVAGAARGFDLDYWGNSFRESALWLVADLRKTYGVSFAQRTFRVVVCGPEGAVAHFLPPNMTLTPTVDDADFVVALNRAGWDACAPGAVMHRVERLGALLSLVVDRRGLRHAEGSASSALR